MTNLTNDFFPKFSRKSNIKLFLAQYKSQNLHGNEKLNMYLFKANAQIFLLNFSKEKFFLVKSIQF